MDSIEKVLEKYFDGESSLAEEQRLRVFFSQENIPASLQIYKPMFVYLSEKINEKENIPLEDKIKITSRFDFLGWKIAAVAASIFVCIMIQSRFFSSENKATISSVYINGALYKDLKTIQSKALLSIEDITYLDQDFLDDQISMLESFGL